MSSVLDVVPWERPRGWFGEEQFGWYVVPVSRGRDSDALSRSNFRVALDLLGGESGDVKIVRSSHWACGWVDQLLVRGDEKLAIAQDIADSLKEYPLLNEEDYSESEEDDQ
jgi:hypothetical protein